VIAQNNGIFMLFKKVIVGPSEKNDIWGSKMAKCDFRPKIQDGRPLFQVACRNRKKWTFFGRILPRYNIFQLLKG
jgi:hypothetical protein